MSSVPVVTYLGPAEPKVEVVVDESRAREPDRVREATLIVSGELALRGGPRETLREVVSANSQALAEAVIDGAVGDGSVNRGRLALSAIHEVDPPLHASVRGGIPRTAEEVAGLSLAELRSVADALGIER